MKRTKNGLSYLCIIIAVFTAAACTLRVPTNFPRDTSIDAELYIPDFVAILGDSWYAGEVEVATVSDDFKGRPSSLVYRADLPVYHEGNDFPLLRYTILIYDNSESALERYLIQRDVLFFDDPRDSSTWDEISTESVPNADQSHAACRNTSSESVGVTLHCMGIFLYGQNIVVLDVRPVRYSVRYFPDTSVHEFFQAIDSILRNL